MKSSTDVSLYVSALMFLTCSSYRNIGIPLCDKTRYSGARVLGIECELSIYLLKNTESR